MALLNTYHFKQNDNMNIVINKEHHPTEFNLFIIQINSYGIDIIVHRCISHSLVDG